MLENGGRGLIKALENWAKKVTSGYRDVEVRDLSTSFRDGMAFCAIVHHYRPDLINFDSLSKENIYENNSLAFGVAEKQLGVPALLDAEDMVKYSHPDRLSIITYLSQLRNCFENQNKVSKKPELKRIQSNSSGPPAKVMSVVPSLMPAKRHEVCQVCSHRVFILERLIVDGKLYHTTCFRCHRCQALLNPGAYAEGDAPGQYECTVCVTDEPDNDNSMDTVAGENNKSMDVASEKFDSPTPSPQIVRKPEKDFRSNKESISFARSNLFEEEEPKSPSDPISLSSLPDSRDRSGSGVSVKDKINVFEKNLTRPPKSPLPSPVLSRPPIPRPRQSLLLSSPDAKTEASATNQEEGSKEEEERTSPGKGSSRKTLFPAQSGSESPRLSARSSELSSPLRELNGKNLFPLKSGSESPRVPRDIFKSSLSPLKLNLPSSLRREPDSEKSFSLSPVSPRFSTTLPYSRSLSLLKQPRSDLKVKDLEAVSDAKPQSDPQGTRRSSLESGSKEEKTSTESMLFSRTQSSQEIRGDVSKPVPTSTYTPVYKGLYGTSSPNKITFRHSYAEPKTSYEQDYAKDESNKISESSFSEKDSPDSKKMDEKSIEPEDSEKGAPSPPAVPQAVVTFEKEITKEEEEDEEKYPDDLNPFGDDDEKETEEEYPDDLNPFGDDEEEIVTQGSLPNRSKVSVEDYDESKNPFASDEDEDEDSSKISAANLTQGNKTPNDSLYSDVSSPGGSMRGTLKKRRAPAPPRVVDIFPPKDSAADSGVESSFSSPSLSRKNFQTSSPKARKSKPAPPPPPTPPAPQDPAATAKKGKESDNMKLRMQQQQQQLPKKKKRPAPSVPIHLRRDMKKIPLKEIMREMKEIEEKQREYERQGREIELLIRDKDKEEEASVEEEEYIMQLFELVNQKNALFRRQAELMYIKRSQRLEEMQHQVEKEIRQLMEKPEAEKTEEDRQKEEELTMELIDIVDQRNSIIDSIEMDRRRELEEDHSVQEQLEIKNAEIKQKSGKEKKKKAKKEKKKEKEEDSGKGTLKKKKNLFKRS